MTLCAFERNIIDFIAVILDCLHSTSHADDRNTYLQDVALATEWLASIHRGAKTVEVVEKILDPQTDKYFGDYWRQGEWGEIELAALKDLQTKATLYLK